MALAAGQHRRINPGVGFAERRRDIAVRDHKFAGIIGFISVACIAADGFFHQRHGLVEVHLIGFHAHVVHKFREVGRFAGQAVCQRVGPLSLRNIHKRVFMSTGAAVVFCKAESLVNIHEIRILFEIIRDVLVLRIILHRGHDLGIHGLIIVGVRRAVLSGGRDRIRLLVVHVFTGQRADLVTVLEMIHQILAAQNAGNEQGKTDHERHGDDCFDQTSLLIHLRPPLLLLRVR